MIADEAVEAAAKAHAENGGGTRWEDWEQDAKDEAIADMRAALEAAAPHMLDGVHLVQKFGLVDAASYQPHGHLPATYRPTP